MRSAARPLASLLLMASALMYFVLGSALVWWLVRAIVDRRVYRRGDWYGRALEPGTYWFYVGVNGFWIAAWIVMLVVMTRACARSGGWHGAVTRMEARLKGGGAR